MTLEVVYWIALGIGVAFLLLSIVFGDVFGFLDFLDFDIGGGFTATPVVFTTIAAFGAGGLLGLNAFNLSAGVSVASGLAAAVLIGGMAVFFFAALHRQEAADAFGTDQLIDLRGRCTLSIVQGKSGQVSVHHEGMTRRFTATSTEDIAAGDDVLVVDVIGDTLRVKRILA